VPSWFQAGLIGERVLTCCFLQQRNGEKGYINVCESEGPRSSKVVASILNDDGIAMKKILIVDDDPAVRLTLRDVLFSKDRVITEVANISDARLMLKRDHYDLILLDLYLPDGDGIQVLAELATNQAVIIMTAYGNWQTHIKAYQLGAYYYLDKPFKITQVRSLVNQALWERYHSTGTFF
jgi:CheY-like chemotaxis protein